VDLIEIGLVVFVDFNCFD